MKIDLFNLPHVNWGYDQWYVHFKNNKPLELVFDEYDKVDQDEQRLVYNSVKAFALGEASDGKTFKSLIKSDGLTKGNLVYQDIMDMFIVEENFHSFYLKKWMAYNQMNLGSHKLSKIFKKLRNSSGLYKEIQVLITAEIIALSYYQALGRVTSSPELKRITRKMVEDETPHAILQSQMMGRLGYTKFRQTYRRWFTEAVVFVTWKAFRELYKKAGYSYESYKEEVFYHQSQCHDIACKFNSK